ncbi:exocyst complex component Sec10-like protein [Irpex rosettiformis]|uniref:Exocyst complex component Sec10-like protein n=1 Tax=Irpex rosettiformis TaxID=378272 RepID=A0ACB8TP95_9APHY|nr:exocyst complex component Sec10-like protein [Irpex rosettiformis]
MDKFTTLEPVKLYQSVTSSKRTSTFPSAKPAAPFSLIGRLPVDVHILILTYVAIPDIPAYALTSRALGRLSKDERVWEARWKAFGIDRPHFNAILDELESQAKTQAGARRGQAPPTLAVENADDDFGDFTDVSAPTDEMGDFVSGFGSVSIQSPSIPSWQPKQTEYRARYIRAHNLLKPFARALSAPPHAILSSIFPPPAPSLSTQSHTLRLLSIFFSYRVKPLRAWTTLASSLRAAMDLFAEGLLTAFDASDGKGDEKSMLEVAQASWDVWDPAEGHWELARAWADKHEVFYDSQSKWDPLENFTKDEELDFDAMDTFITAILAILQEQGSRAVRVFPPDAHVLLSFAERMANEVVGEYISSLLTRAREISNAIYLRAVAASFRESWRIVDVVMQVASQRADAVLPKTRAEDVVYRMFEPNMDEYLDEELESLKQSFDTITKGWDKNVGLLQHSNSPTATHEQARFIGSHNPAQVKRNVLASFTDVLLLPVTIVPRTTMAVGKAFGAALTTGGTAAAQGIAMLNPQRWGGSSMQWGGGNQNDKSRNGYVDFEKSQNGAMVFDIGDDEDEEEEKRNEKASFDKFEEEKPQKRASVASIATTTTLGSSHSVTPSISSSSTRISTPVPPAASASFDTFEMLLSLDTALELIHADRDSLKRTDTFSGYPGQYGHRVRDTIEEIFVLVLQALGDRHIKPGFERATQQMRAYKPAEHEETNSVAPLLQFFELVHIGDTMQSMIQVYFDKEIASHIDKNDFLNTVVREKKRFEDVLDDSVAAGLNMGTETLMNQVEHIITKLTKPREYYPPEGVPLELGPTQGCTEAIKCLKMHCQLLKGSTSKEVLEVFYQEIGIRLIAILQKHIKRQIISLNGGFQVIADLNAYHAFITSLKVASITSEFAYLKMLGHVYVVEDAKDLAQIVRDVTRYGGAYRPEDIYEFIQRRSDWKKIEKTVDKTMYNLSFKEDCIIS